MHEQKQAATLDYATPQADLWIRWRKQLFQIAKHIILAGIVVMIVGAAVLIVVEVLVYRPRKVADIAGPAGSTANYELWWGKRGTLRFQPADGAWQATALDYYESTQIAQAGWIDNDTLELRTNDGNTFTIQLSVKTLTVDYTGWKNSPAATRPAAP
jgi:VCBS repeat-containing protein